MTRIRFYTDQTLIGLVETDKMEKVYLEILKTTYLCDMNI